MIEVEAKISIKRNGIVLLNPSKTALLIEIKQCGSLNAAAKNLNISYQHAWNLINEMNRNAPMPLVIKRRGGINGGGAAISEYGLKILEDYQSIGFAILKTISQINVEINL